MTTITFQNDPVTLSGTPPTVGTKAPTFRLSQNPVEDTAFTGARERPLLLTTAPSVDTPVCAAQLRAFDAQLQEAAAQRPFDLWFVTRDLPFALERFAGEHDIKDIDILSDFKHRSLGEAFGLEIQELGLLARTVFFIDRDGTVLYREIVSEIGAEPDYNAAIEAAAEPAA